MGYKRLWLILIFVIVASFAVLGYYGREIYRQSPPIPGEVVSADGKVLFTGDDIRDGQNVWQSIGGQELGSIWGHGAYVAPDWTADWLHREALWLADHWAHNDHQKSFADLSPERQVGIKVRLKAEYRSAAYVEEKDAIVVSADRALAIEAIGRYYGAIFQDAKEFPDDLKPYADGGYTPVELRDAYAMAANTIKDPERQRLLNAFYWWASWACATDRPVNGELASSEMAVPITYTNNWPAETLIENKPSSDLILWSIISVLLLLLSIGLLTWYRAVTADADEELHGYPANDPLLELKLTPSMKATLRYFWIVTALFVFQVLLGIITAHYGVEGDGLYGFPLAEYLPYSVVRTWHTQIAIFWIATAWLATGLYISPAVSGYEPKWQHIGVNFLLACLVVIVVGTLFGTWYGTRQEMGYEMNFWFGHQGFEYVDLGRFWQIFLLIGLFLWLGLMIRALWPAFRKPTENKHLLSMFLLSSASIALFYGAGLMWGQQTNLAISEYWRWWVVHLWVEGFFEVFATVVIAFLFTRMGLLNVASATKAVLLSASIFLAGGIIGTFHHLYFTGTPLPILALGACFSALEVAPLVLIGYEAYENLKLSKAKEWIRAYRWPIYFFVAVAFWNFVGAGLFGFLINPPIALYYMQGLNTTAVHGHSALFGVYGMLGIGLMLFCLRGHTIDSTWKTGALKFGFWSLNIGLTLMVVLSLLPVGILQTIASIDHGMWYARSAEFMQSDLLENLRWARAIGDTIFAVGVFAIAYFVLGLTTGWSCIKKEPTKHLR